MRLATNMLDVPAELISVSIDWKISKAE